MVCFTFEEVAECQTKQKKGTKYNITPCLISHTAVPIKKVLKLAGITAPMHQFKLEIK